MNKRKEKVSEKIWEDFKRGQNLSDKQIEKFKKYSNTLIEWSKDINLTAIRDLSGIIRQHFIDSFELKNHFSLTKIKTMADIGTGAGFPSIPLKILYPHLKLFLIEVNKKKQKFLNFLIEELDLQNVEIVNLDWRTFLRKTTFDIDIFVTKAALNDLELSRMFKPACFYKNSTLVYLASEDWEPHLKVEKFVFDYKFYTLGKKRRKLVFMKLP
ncbi:16S rRNA (guanine(527)-N(7))-methyltransferase RsmG [Candidatus Babeliales bacterium]|nr:16S rRNA (guanine(527)-N(7))-methyltransferase RsmG [Candidatus Babeliales bacterium]